MINRFILLTISLMLSHSAFSAIQCGPYRLTGDGMTVINGDKVTSQRVTYLGKKGDEANTRYQMNLMPASDGYNYGFEFIKRNGKAWLNVELLLIDRNLPRFIGTFDCKKVS